METSTTMDTNAPSGESLESFLESVRVDALRANLSSIQNSSDYLSIAIFAENKLNCLSNFMFPDINVSNNISVDLIKIIEEARLKFSILKHQEMKDDLNQFTNLCLSWGIQNPATQTPFVLAKPRQRKNSLPGETSKKQKLEATTCQNKFSVLYIEDPPEELQIDEPLPPSPTPEKTTTKPKKKHGPSKKPASLANKQPPAPTPVITAAQIAQPRIQNFPESTSKFMVELALNEFGGEWKYVESQYMLLSKINPTNTKSVITGKIFGALQRNLVQRDITKEEGNIEK
ncbi:hypothetical protein NPIL_4251 [Nephila pilipes]|uniref:Uncharacterized protein n=1 Tax=Nephila pilipes TaxID=299642 RepID=A0A8X6MJL7_NEPPI|nr:hypothetical protein NPIL_4251 [Nephila pilipes]